MGLNSEIYLASRDEHWTSITDTAGRLRRLRGQVDADGGEAVFEVALTNKKPFSVVVASCEMPQFFTEIRRAQMLMALRQRLHLDHGAARLLELCETALQPVSVDMLSDPATNDHLVVHQFDDHAPIIFRFAPGELVRRLALFQATLQQLAN